MQSGPQYLWKLLWVNLNINVSIKVIILSYVHAWNDWMVSLCKQYLMYVCNVAKYLMYVSWSALLIWQRGPICHVIEFMTRRYYEGFLIFQTCQIKEGRTLVRSIHKNWGGMPKTKKHVHLSSMLRVLMRKLLTSMPYIRVIWKLLASHSDRVG